MREVIKAQRPSQEEGWEQSENNKFQLRFSDPLRYFINLFFQEEFSGHLNSGQYIMAAHLCYVASSYI